MADAVEHRLFGGHPTNTTALFIAACRLLVRLLLPAVVAVRAFFSSLVRWLARRRRHSELFATA
eukprot:m.43894 g.43894  ORF g.43894 m.43894 type:complete len:64 (-) comp11665_c0_seq4:2475-2666(-)